MALTKEYLIQQIIIGVANSNSSQPVGDTIAKMVHGVEVVTDSETSLQTVSVADPLETDWDLGSSWVTHGVLDFLSNYELAKILFAFGVDRNGRTARVVEALQLVPEGGSARVIDNTRLLALSALLDAEKTRRGI